MVPIFLKSLLRPLVFSIVIVVVLVIVIVFRLFIVSNHRTAEHFEVHKGAARAAHKGDGGGRRASISSIEEQVFAEGGTVQQLRMNVARKELLLARDAEQIEQLRKEVEDLKRQLLNQQNGAPNDATARAKNVPTQPEVIAAQPADSNVVRSATDFVQDALKPTAKAVVQPTRLPGETKPSGVPNAAAVSAGGRAEVSAEGSVLINSTSSDVEKVQAEAAQAKNGANADAPDSFVKPTSSASDSSSVQEVPAKKIKGLERASLLTGTPVTDSEGVQIVYRSSVWEQEWISNIRRWTDEKAICRVLTDADTQNALFLRKYLNATCTMRFEGSDWCRVDTIRDLARLGDRRGARSAVVYFNAATGEYTAKSPFSSVGDVNDTSKNATVAAVIAAARGLDTVYPSNVRNFTVDHDDCCNDPAIWSYFERTYPDGVVERDYIEPLVSHLRHPLAKCRDLKNDAGHLVLLDKTWVLPPPRNTRLTKNRNSNLFDAGASLFTSGPGGPSLEYFTRVWKERASVNWTKIEAWECAILAAGRGGSLQALRKSVPQQWKSRTFYHHECVSGNDTHKPHLFLPLIIKNRTQPQDYTLFKLDIDNKKIERRTVEYFLEPDKRPLDFIKEFVWEHHVVNYLMGGDWKDTADFSKSIADSYEFFLRLRQQGVRAHSWV